MYLGKIVEFANAADLFARPLHPYTQALLSAIPTPVVGREAQADRAVGRRAEPDEPAERLPLPDALPARAADLRRGRAAARAARRRPPRPPATSPARRSRSRSSIPHGCPSRRRPAPARPAGADARRHLALGRRLPAARRRRRCRRSSSGRRTSRRASASSRWGVWFARRGYAAVVVDVRGRYESEGSSPRGSTTGRTRTTRSRGRRASSGRTAASARGGGATAALVQWQLAHLGHPNLVCVAPQVIHDDYFWDGYWTGGAFQLALTLGAAALWSSAMSLITGPERARPRAERPRLRAPAAHRARRGDDRAEGRLLAALVGAPGERRVLAPVPPPPREARRADLPAGRLVRPVLGVAPAQLRADRRPAAEPRADGAVVARGGGRDLPRRRRPVGGA